jgi:hypothetical protein
MERGAGTARPGGAANAWSARFPQGQWKPITSKRSSHARTVTKVFTANHTVGLLCKQA